MLSIKPRVCILTPGQPSSNPRVVKEADALVEAGYEVRVLCAHWAPWADAIDKQLLKTKEWSCTYVDGASRKGSRYYWSRFRHSLSRRLAPHFSSSSLDEWAFCRVLPELRNAAIANRADLYISHYPETLSAAVIAAERHHAKVGFDIEDLYTSSVVRGKHDSPYDELVEQNEARLLPRCDYLTVSSPPIGEAYSKKYNLTCPTTILNVFPLSSRPSKFRPTTSNGSTTLYWFSQTIGADRGLEDIVEAMARIGDTSIQLHLRGSCSLFYKAKLLRLAKSSSCRPKIVFHPPDSPDRMIGLAAEYDVGLSLEQPNSENRNLCYLTNKFGSYLLAGNAVIATATDGQRSSSDALGAAVFSYEPGDIASVAEQLRYWSSNRRELDLARKAAWWAGSIRYNWDLEKKKFLDLVNRTLVVN